MKRPIATLVLIAALLLPVLVTAQVKSVTGGTGAITFGLGRYGNFWLNDGAGVSQLDRATILVALDTTHVFDYYEDSWYLMTPTKDAGGKSDTTLTSLFDNTYQTPAPPPDARVLETVYSWLGDSFVLVRYGVTNYSASPYTVSIGMGLLPIPSGTYGGETVAYDATKKMAYFFRQGEAPYVGAKLMSQDPASFHVLDWDVYSPTDASNDAATDATRYHMTHDPGFDGSLVAGVDGSFANLNVGSKTIAAGDSIVFTMAYMYSTSLDGLRTVSDAAATRFAKLTSVEPVSMNIPDGFALLQNYPNPFNPGSAIDFQIAKESPVTLKVYNAVGQEVKTLVNETLVPGRYTARFDGSALASGVYLYRLTAGSFVQTKQMVLLK
jgi:hypothetical protein